MKIKNWNKIETNYWENRIHVPALRVWIRKEHDFSGPHYEVFAGEIKAYAPVINPKNEFVTSKRRANEIANNWMKLNI